MFAQELIDTPAWCVWKYEQLPNGKWTKVPLCPINLHKIDVTEEKNWHDYNVAVSATASHPDRCSLAFIFHPYHGYGGADMDDPWKDLDPSNPAHQVIAREIAELHAKVYPLLNTYTEMSPSGRGWHSIFKGKLPANFRNRVRGLEIYSQGRFFTMTGNVVNPGTPIRNIVSDMDALGAILGTKDANVDVRKIFVLEPRYSDQDLLNKAATEPSGDRFIAAWNGKFHEMGLPSASEVDLALANYLSAHTDNWEQVKRIFMESPHYKREDRSKLRNRPELLDKVVDASFNHHWLPEDLSKLKAQIATVVNTPAVVETPAEPEQPAPVEYTAPSFNLRPPGLMGRIADFIYHNAARPIREIALGGAIGLMAGICGRAWNFHGLGLNHYICILLDSGAGKDAMRHGMTRLMSEVEKTHKSAMQFMGPSHIASGPALYNELRKEGAECFVSYIGEFGHKLAALTDDRAQKNDLDLMRAILDLYSASGPGQVIQKSVYADSDNNTTAVKSPSFSFVGDSTPEVFWEAVTDAAVSSGLIPRLTLIPYTGPRPRTNRYAGVVPIPQDLIDQLTALVSAAQARTAKGLSETLDIDGDAEAELDRFDIFCDQQYNAAKGQAQKAMWARAYQKCLKLAALLAVGINPNNARISMECVLWAKAFVAHDLDLILRRFATGEQSTNAPTSDRERYILSSIKRYLGDSTVISKYGVQQAIHAAGFVDHRYLQRVTAAAAPFRKAHGGASRALHETIKHMIDMGMLAELPMNVVSSMTGGRKLKAYQITDMEAVKTAASGTEKPSV